MSEVKKCENCGNEQIQILNYKGDYLCGICGRDTERMHEIEHDAEVRAKTIDEFAERLKTSQDAYSWCCVDGSMEYCNGDHCEDCMEDFKEKIDKIADQLKGGAE